MHQPFASSRRRLTAIVPAFLVALAAISPASAQTPDPSPVTPPPSDAVIQVDDMELFVDLFVRPPETARDEARRRGSLGFQAYSSQPWPAGELPISFDASVTQAQREQFFATCRVWNSFTGVRCVSRTTQSSGAVVTANATQCSSHVGRYIGNITIRLGDGCWTTRVITHELGHAFGLTHEHQRSDRDLFVEIRFDNVESGKEDNFDLLPTSRVVGGYDFDSVMHYLPTAFSRNSQPTLVARGEFAASATRMGQASAPSDLDRRALASIYNLAPAERRGGGSVPRFDRGDFLNAMEDLHAVYRGELRRPDGLSIGGRPDFLGVAAWIFDVYLSSRATGYTEGESFYNVRAWISQSDEWRGKNPGQASLRPLAVNSPVRLDRGEYLDAMFRLDDAYRAELLRPNGLSLNGQPDFLGIAAWIFDVYLNNRLSGRTPEQAWSAVLAAIRASDEYRRRH